MTHEKRATTLISGIFNPRKWAAFLCFIFAFGYIPLSSPLTASAAAGINQQIPFQGRVINTNGTNISSGSFSFVFSIYTVSSGGAAVWTETKTLTVTNGIFATYLGSVTSLPGSLDFNTDTIYLGINFNSDGEMVPRIRLGAVPQAFNAQTVNGLTVTSTTGTLTIPNATTVSFGGAFTTASSVNLAGSLTTVGANSLSITTTGATSVTFPTSGTLATLSGTETFANKTIGASTLTGDFLPTSNNTIALGTSLLRYSSIYGTALDASTLSLSSTATVGSTLTASNGLTVTTGAVNLTGTSGALSLTGLGASSISTGSNNFTITSNNVNTTATGINNTVIGATTPAAATFTTLGVTSSGTFGLNGGTGGSLVLNGSTSGAVSIKTSAAAGTYNFNLPTTAGTSGYVLTSGGGSSTAMSWTDPSGFSVTSATNLSGGAAGNIPYQSAASTTLFVGGSSGQFLTSNGSSAPTFTNIASSLTAGTNISLSGTTNATVAVVNNPTFSGLVTGQAGLTVTGAAIDLNASSNFAVNIGTGTSNAGVAIGGASNTVAITSSGLNLTTAGALSGVTTIAASGAYTQSGSGANTFTGATSFTAAATGLSVTNNQTIGGDLTIGSKISIGNTGLALAFNRNVTAGTVYNSSASAYQFNHTENATPASDYLALQVYDGAGTSIQPLALVVRGSGYVGIGTATPLNSLTVSGPAAAPTNTGSAQNGITRLSDNGGNTSSVLDTGILSANPYTGWLQVRASNDYTQNFGLALNPNGGNVVIGSTNPAKVLTIYNSDAVIRYSRAGSYEWDAGVGNNTNGIPLSYFGFRDVSNSSTPLVISPITGLVGIGTTAPAQALHVAVNVANETSGLRLDNQYVGGYGSALRFYSTQNFGGNATVESARIQVQGEANYTSAPNTSSYLHIDTVSAGTLAERVRVTAAGSVGIGTTSPTAKLSVFGSVSTGVPAASGSADSTQLAAIIGDNVGASGLGIYFGVNGADGTAFIQNRAVSDFSANYPLLINPNGGNVSIGTTSTLGKLNVVDSSHSLTSDVYTQYIQSNDSQAADLGGSLGFGGVYTGSITTVFGSIAARKENSTAGNYAGYLTLAVRAAGSGAPTEALRIASTGIVGIGVAPSSDTFLNLSHTFTGATTGEQYGIHNSTAYNTADTGIKQGIRSDLALNNTSGTISNAASVIALTSTGGSGGTVGSASAFWARNDVASGATVTNAYGLSIYDGTGAGTITNQYGLYIAALTKGSNSNYAIYSEASTPSLLAGALSLGGNLTISKTADAALTVSSSAGRSDVIIDGAAGNYKMLQFKTGGSLRFATLLSNTAESGSNAGSDYTLARYADDASFLATALSITRSTGDTTIYGATTLASSGTGLSVTNNATIGGILSAQGGLSSVSSVTSTAAGVHANLESTLTVAPSGSSSAMYVGTVNLAQYTGSNALTGAWGSGGLIGSNNSAQRNGAATGNVTNAYGTVSGVQNTAASVGTITNSYALFADTAYILNSNLVTNAYGLYVADQAATGVTNAYGIYQAGATTANILAGPTTLTASGTALTVNNNATISGTATLGAISVVDSNATISRSSNDLLIQTNAGYKLRLNGASDNLVGIGTVAPATTAMLTVSDASASNRGNIRLISSNVNSAGVELRSTRDGTNHGFSIYDANASATRLSIDSSGNTGIGTSAPVARLQIAGDQSTTAQGASGVALRVVAATYTDTSSSGTVAQSAVSSFNAPTLAASSATTYTNAATLYIAGVPTAGSNVTITNSLSLQVAGSTALQTYAAIGGKSISGSNQLSIYSAGTYNSEGSNAIRIFDNEAVKTVSLNVGVDAALNAAYIQAMEPGVSFSTKSLLLQPNGGSVGIGNTATSSLFSVGSSSQFQVNSSGAIAASTAIANSGAYTQSGTSANTFTGATTFSAASTALAVTNNATIGGTATVPTIYGGTGTTSTLKLSSTSNGSPASGNYIALQPNAEGPVLIGGTTIFSYADALEVYSSKANTVASYTHVTSTSGTNVAQSAAIEGVGSAKNIAFGANALSGTSNVNYFAGNTAYPASGSYNLYMAGAFSNYFSTLSGFGTVSPVSLVDISGTTNTYGALSLVGKGLNVSASTWEDSATSAGTSANATINSFGIPTISTTTNAVTYTNASNVYIAGAPVAGSNVTLTNSFALRVAGNAYYENAVGIGTVPISTAQLNVSKAYSGATGSEQYGLYVNTSYATADSSIKQGIRSDASFNNTSGTIVNGAGIISLATGAGVGGTVTNLSAFWARPDVGGGTVTSAMGLSVHDSNGSGTVTSQYGIYVDSLTKGATNYALYTAGTTPSLLGGNLSVNGTTIALANSGNVGISAVSSTGRSDLTIDGAAGQYRMINYRTAGNARFTTFVSNDAEAGSNAGSDFYISRYADNGSWLGNGLTITRSTGAVTLAGSATVVGGIFYGAAVGNSSDLSNSYVQTPTTGTVISRNIADANNALSVNQVNASSTGKILSLQFGGVEKMSVGIDGTTYIGATATVSGGNYYGSGLSNLSSGDNAYVQTPTTGTLITRNVADGETVLRVHQTNASSTGKLLALFFNSVEKLGVSNAGTITTPGGYTQSGSVANTFTGATTIDADTHISSANNLYLDNSDNTNYYYLDNPGATGATNSVLRILQGNVGEAARFGAGGKFSIGSTSLTSMFNVGSSNEFQVDSGGKVGIGRAIGSNPLTIQDTGTDAGILMRASTGNNFLRLAFTTGDKPYIDSTGGQDMVFMLGGSGKLTISSALVSTNQAFTASGLITGGAGLTVTGAGSFSTTLSVGGVPNAGYATAFASSTTVDVPAMYGIAYAAAGSTYYNAGVRGHAYVVSGSGIGTGVYGISDGTNTGTNVGGYFAAANATNNYALLIGSGSVGIGTTAPGTKLDVAGGLTLRAGATVNLTADNQVVTVGDISYIRLSSDNGTSTNRTMLLTVGLQQGQVLTLEWTGANAGELVDDSANSGSGNIRLSATWTPAANGTLSLLWNGTDWIETARSAN